MTHADEPAEVPPAEHRFDDVAGRVAQQRRHGECGDRLARRMSVEMPPSMDAAHAKARRRR